MSRLTTDAAQKLTGVCGCFSTGSHLTVKRITKDYGPKPPSVDNNWFNLSKVWDLWEYVKRKPQPKTPKWLSNPHKPSKSDINATTKRYLTDLFYTDISAEFLLMTKMEMLFQHMTRNPETKQYAVKMGCIERLLEIRTTTPSPGVCQQARKTLSSLGYADPPKSRGVRILSIDGGGMRGIAVIRMLKEIEKITNKSIIDSFDLICGVSTGAIIIGCMLPPTSMNLDQIEATYQDFSAKVFNQSTIIGTGRMLWYHGYYDTQAWESLLKRYVGDLKLIDTAQFAHCPKVLAISTISVQSRVAPFIFRNYDNPKGTGIDYYGTYNASVFETIRASSAAPTIFEEIRIDGIPHMDGGIVLNNPTALAIHEAKNLWPNEEISCLVSCGTGLHDPVLTLEDLKDLSQSPTSWKAILDKICASATDTEAVHKALNDLMLGDTYFRLNPPLSKYIVMDEVDKKNLSLLVEDTKMYCRRNKESFESIAKRLVMKRAKRQLLMDQAKLSFRIFQHQMKKGIK